TMTYPILFVNVQVLTASGWPRRHIKGLIPPNLTLLSNPLLLHTFRTLDIKRTLLCRVLQIVNVTIAVHGKVQPHSISIHIHLEAQIKIAGRKNVIVERVESV
ncbi:hypothetical protein H0H93_004091, partial [Arthromyces matolae]